MKKIIITALFLFISMPCWPDESSPVSENSLKAAFIYHFITFTEWNDNLPNYYVCIPNNEPLKKSAQDIFKGKLINGRNVIVSGQSQYCHVLVSEEPSSDPYTLTIGELNKGALLEFRRIGNKLKFAVNMENIKKTKLKISSQLLKLAILDNP
jgi:hypothetical protein